jgi:methylenetetrahydrofolate dehydrogenase (NADP+)/methenyltetrahydrofolate cyclohydrolase
VIEMDGVVLRAEMIAAIRAEVDAAAGRRAPCLATIVVGDNPRCHAFARDKRSAAAEAGITTVAVDLDASATQHEVEAALGRLAADPKVDGIFLQLPLPDHLHPVPIPPTKDVDGADAGSHHAPSTAAAVVRLLDRYDIATAGRRVVIVGRRHPAIAHLLAARDADVTVLAGDDDDGPPSPDDCRLADVLIVVAGRPRSITADHVQPGAAVVDVVGAVDLPSVIAVAGAVAPYPTAVGPVAVACLLRHTLDAAR